MVDYCTIARIERVEKENQKLQKELKELKELQNENNPPTIYNYYNCKYFYGDKLKYNERGKKTNAAPKEKGTSNDILPN